MNNLQFDPIVAQWLSDGPAEGPEHALQRALALTRTHRQQSRWEFPRMWLPAPVAEVQVPRVVVIGALLVLTLSLLIALAVAVGGRFLQGPLVLSPTDEVIAFAEAGEIYVARPDGSDRRPLNANVPNAADPLFSPDGTHVAFLAKASVGGGPARLLIASVDGSTPTLLEVSADLDVVVGDIPNVSWSSDGSRIAFAARAGANAQIFVVNRDGSSLRAITDGSAHSDLPSWSPIAEFGLYVGDWIAYRVTKPDQQLVSFERVHPDGTAPELFSAVLGADVSLSKLTWSPFDPAQPGHLYVNSAYAMNAGFGSDSRALIDGGGGHQLEIWTAGTGGFADAPVQWSPDSRFLAFISADGGLIVGDDDRTLDVYDGDLREFGPVLDCWVDWSPDSQYLYGGAPNDCAGIVAVPLANPLASTRLTNEPGTASWRRVP